MFAFGFGQEDIERYKVYNTTNTYTSLLLDSSTGQIWQLQIGLSDVDQLKIVLSDYKYAETIDNVTEEYNKKMEYWEVNYNSKSDSIVSTEVKKYYKPMSFKDFLGYRYIAENGRFKLYPTGNMYNFIMVDTIDGRTFQVQWSIKEEERIVSQFY